MIIVSRIIHVKVDRRLMSQINSNIKDDFKVVLLLSCFVGHPVHQNIYIPIFLYLKLKFLALKSECGVLVENIGEFLLNTNKYYKPANQRQQR